MDRYPIYLFDFDYTLANSERAILKCFHLTLAKCALPDAADDAIRRTIGLPMAEAVARIAHLSTEEEIARFITSYKVEADRYMTPLTQFYPNTVATLAALKASGARIAIVSNKTGSRVREKFDLAGLSLIDCYVGSEDVAAPKPAPEGIEKALRFFGAKRREVLYTGDSATDAQAAQNAGVDFAGVATGVTTREALAAFPHRAILGDISEVLSVAPAGTEGRA